MIGEFKNFPRFVIGWFIRLFVLIGCRRTGSGVSIDSLGANFGPTEDNYDSSDTDSESKNEAQVRPAKKVRNCSKKNMMCSVCKNMSQAEMLLDT